MATKLIRGEQALEAAPIHWPLLEQGAPARSPETSRAEELRALQLRVAELERELSRREQQAFDAGYRKGAAEGQQQAAAQWKPLLDEFAKSLRELQQARRRLRREAERDVVKLAIAVARRILHRELNVDPGALLGIVKAALDTLESREVDRLRVHPADAPAIRDYLERAGMKRIELAPDPHLARGAVVLETAQGCLDASVETQLEEIQRGLLDRLLKQP